MIKYFDMYENFLCNEGHPEECMFYAMKLKQNEIFSTDSLSAHLLVFCVKGGYDIYSGILNETVEEGEIIFLPRSAEFHLKTKEDSVLLLHTFDNATCNPAYCLIGKFCSDDILLPQPCYKLVIHEVLKSYVNNLLIYILHFPNDRQLWYLKHVELMKLFLQCYKRDQLLSFFRLLTGDNFTFRKLVYTHYRFAMNSVQLAESCGYGITNFRRVFKKEFHVPVYQWLKHKKAERLFYALAYSDLSFEELSDTFNFNSIQQLNRFCKSNIGYTPGEIRKKYKT